MNIEENSEIFLTGRVIEVRRRKLKSGRLLSIGNVLSQGEVWPFFFEHSQISIRKGDYINLYGSWKSVNHVETFVSEELKHQFIPPQITNFSEHVSRGLDPKKMGLLRIRSIVEAEIHAFLKSQDFCPISSPAIVSDWVLGQTGSFPFSFYNAENCNLTISNLLYHQLVINNGMTKVYELGKLFRKENPSNKKRLAEFTILDISFANANLQKLMDDFESILRAIHDLFLKFPLQNAFVPLFPREIKFDQIDFRTLLKNCDLSEIQGHQLPKKVEQYLNDNFSSFVWITGFPIHTRPFYTKSNSDGYCVDAQLWYQGKIYVGAGGEFEFEKERIKQKIIAEGKDPKRFEFYLEAMGFGAPEISGMTMGLERVLAAWLGNGLTAADFAYFPRYQNNYMP